MNRQITKEKVEWSRNLCKDAQPQEIESEGKKIPFYTSYNFYSLKIMLLYICEILQTYRK